jgi:large subunit ribosomal protein L22
MSASKVRQVLDQIRGQDVDRAAETLSLGDREAAVTVGKVLASAVANAVHNDGLDAEELFVSACYADEGSTLKRWRPRARGRATRIRKRTSHITIIVSRLPEERLARRRAQQAASGTQRSRRVAGSRRRQRAESTGTTETTETKTKQPTSPVGDDETGAEAWSEDAVQADDVLTETEAGPLEESDIDAEGDDTGADGADDATDATDDTDGTTTDETDTDDEHDPDGDSAEEKGK